MTRMQTFKRNYRSGVTFQSSCAPSLYAPSTGRLLAPAFPEAFAAQQKHLTTFDMIGKVGGKPWAAILKPIVDGKLRLAKLTAEAPSEVAADAVADAILGDTLGVQQ